jgi:Uma2 family endonuclease
LEEAGLLELKRHELIDGALVRKVPKSRPHALALHFFHDWLREVFGSRHVEQGASIDLGPLLSPTNEPDPAATVLRRPVTEFWDENPGPPDLLLVAEVTDTTLEYVLGTKAALYASAGIPEYWVLDLRNMRIVVHRDPVGQRYGSIVGYAADEAFSPWAAASALVRMQDFVPR